MDFSVENVPNSSHKSASRFFACKENVRSVRTSLFSCELCSSFQRNVLPWRTDEHPQKFDRFELTDGTRQALRLTNVLLSERTAR